MRKISKQNLEKVHKESSTMDIKLEEKKIDEAYRRGLLEKTLVNNI